MRNGTWPKKIKQQYKKKVMNRSRSSLCRVGGMGVVRGGQKKTQAESQVILSLPRGRYGTRKESGRRPSQFYCLLCYPKYKPKVILISSLPGFLSTKVENKSIIVICKVEGTGGIASFLGY